jgi:hypothetical protein
VKRKILIASLMLALFTVACGAVRIPGIPGGNQGANVNRNRPTRTPGPTVAPIDPRVQGSAFTPIPTYDVVSKLVTQAYALYTPTPGAAATKAVATTPAPSNTSGGAVIVATPVPSSNVIIVPSNVIVNETNNFPNFSNKATCGINRMGDCTPLIKANQDVYFTWTFTNNSTRLFLYGDAMIVINRDGQTFAQMQSNNGRGQLPPDKNAKWQLVVGDFAVFRAGVDKIQPGAYAARLQICQNDPVDCRAGLGWQNAGGEYINFTVTP